MGSVAVTGIGAVCALGNNQKSFWDGLISGKCGIGDISVFDSSGQRTHIAGEVKNFYPENIFSHKQRKRFSRCDELALVAAEEALQQAGLLESLQKNEIDSSRIGIFLGAGAGGSRNGEIYYRSINGKITGRGSTEILCAYAPSCSTDIIGSYFHVYGPRSTVVTACSSSNTAIGYAAEMVNAGIVDIAITGGSDALSELTYTGFNALKAISPEPCKPFDQNRSGLSIGEAAGILILERSENIQKDRREILAEVCGYGLIGEAYHMTAPKPSGQGARQAMELALENSGCSVENIGYVSAHGTATTHNDSAEAKALCEVFGTENGRCKVPVSSIKSMIGHCLGAAGAIESVALVLTLMHQMLPPTINHEVTDPLCPVDCIPNQARPKKLDYALTNSFAFGGNNTSLVFSRGNKLRDL